MATERLEPFRQALLDLRGRLRDGSLAPGARITAKEVAETLRLSATPVREALSRLAGEGLLEERRGQGFFVPELTGVDVAALYRLSEQLLLLAQTTRRPAGPEPPPAGEDPVRAVERLFLAWAAEAGSRIVFDAYRAVATRLAPVRRQEAQLLDDLVGEAASLATLRDGPARRRRPAAIQAFHRRRIALADQLAQRLAPSAQSADERI